MRVAVTGATGMIGRRLVAELLGRGDEVTVLSRDSDRARRDFGGRVEAHDWPAPKDEPAPVAALAGRDAVVHLLGEPVAQRWTDSARREIRDSRVRGTRSLVAALEALPADGDGARPGVLVGQSGSGYYGPRGDERVDESASAGDDFLARICADWEAESRSAGRLGMRVVVTRTGVILASGGGALEKMLPPFKLGVGGPVAGGRQYVPWIHLDDVVGALIACLDDPRAAGAVNLAAPEPVTNAALSRALGRVLGRPAIAPVPAFAVRLLYGDMAQIVTTGVRAVPARLGALGYRFRRPALEPALRSATGRD